MAGTGSRLFLWYVWIDGRMNKKIDGWMGGWLAGWIFGTSFVLTVRLAVSKSWLLADCLTG